VKTWIGCYSPLEGSVPITPYYLINHSVLSTPTFTQSTGRINLASTEDIPSPFSTLDEDNEDGLSFNSKVKETSRVELFTIKTMFNPLGDQNVKVEYTNENRDSFTKKERKFAMKAIQCNSLEDLSQKVSDLLLFTLLLTIPILKCFSLENSYNVGRKL
jgi:hypothetical protein